MHKGTDFNTTGPTLIHTKIYIYTCSIYKIYTISNIHKIYKETFYYRIYLATFMVVLSVWNNTTNLEVEIDVSWQTIERTNK